ncbi:unnamed protein product [Microthlaspi erraticum]|uniref:F-box domain-containing protein n=1 Tax=Microthlaspi erraticum TaxID=1685480 RepID=A0A6D2JAQ1_9BRAS|nr:unnamed protein product [Microthlaspi erraticum]
MNSHSIPYDLMIEIFSRLPKKSIARFYCLSKLWCSTFNRPDFAELFLTRSSARSRLLFAVQVQQQGNVQHDDKWSFLLVASCSISNKAPSNKAPLSSSSSLVAVADFHREFPPTIYRTSRRSYSCGYASGLVYFHGMHVPGKGLSPVICNPKTGHYATLPYLPRYIKADSFFGFDPIVM